MMSVHGALAVAAVGALLASCAARPVALEPGRVGDVARITLAPAGWGELAGWSGDRVAEAVPAFLRSCDRIASKAAGAQAADGAPLDPRATEASFGRVRDWRPLCRVAAGLPAGDDAAARRFFEANFVPVLVASKGGSTGLFTGYWEVELPGSRTQEGPYQYPVYRKPADLTDKPYLERGAIEDGALAGKGLEVAWLQSPDDVFVLQMQGSGRIRLPDGSTMRLVYEANNHRPFVNVYQMLLDGGEIAPAQFSEKSVRGWMRDHPDQAKELRRKDPLYVFFRELKGDGPVGYEGAVLTAERSLAVDHRYIPLGAPLWLDVHDKYRPVAVQRLVVAQDTGDGIVGPLRGDFYWGSGTAAAARGSDFYAEGRYWMLLPRAVATKMVAALN
ncbi:MAG TPA: MltA domain-containing protein [Stellaceae bacterium]|nr:MltA domain-containing protein [Stellaceae bacterium]